MNQNPGSPLRRLPSRSKSGGSLSKMENQSSRSLLLRRNKSYSHIQTLTLDLVELEGFLLALSRFSQDADLRRFSREEFVGLAARLNQANSRSYRLNELDEVATLLSTLLQNASAKLPKRMIAQAHSFTGLIREEQGKFESAVQSLLKALWIQTSLLAMESSPDASNEMMVEVALTNHRLGMTYGHMGDSNQAVVLFEKALQAFEQARMKSGHVCVLQTQAMLEEFKDASPKSLDSSLDSVGKTKSCKSFGSSSPMAQRRTTTSNTRVSRIRIG